MKKVLDHIEEYIIAAGLLIMTTIAFANVLSRYIFHASWSFTEEITTNLFVLCSFLGAAVAAKKGAHLGLSLITDMFPKKFQKYFVLFTLLCAGVFCFILIRYGIDMVVSEYNMGQQTPALGWPQWVFGLSIPIGGIAIFARYAQVAVKAFMEKGEK